MKGKRSFGSVFVMVILLTLVTVGIVQATGYDMTPPLTTVTINGAIFEVFNPTDPSGSGLFDAFVRLSSNKLVIQGYNTSYRPLQFEENNSGTFTKSALLSAVPQFNINGVIYREFQLDINQNTPIPSRYETLDNVELYESDSTLGFLCGYPFDGSVTCGSNNSGTMVYGMDVGEDNFMVLDYTNNTGSGKRDLKLLVPNNLFNQSQACVYGGAGCTTDVTLYSKFGGDSDPLNGNPLLQVPHGNNDGFEEWGVRVGEPTAITLQNITAENGNAGLGFVIAGVGLLAISTILFVVLRKRQGVEA